MRVLKDESYGKLILRLEQTTRLPCGCLLSASVYGLCENIPFVMQHEPFYRKQQLKHVTVMRKMLRRHMAQHACNHDSLSHYISVSSKVIK